MAMTESDKYTLPDPQFEHAEIYPKWWGHREFCADPEEAQGRERERWACPRRMVDEMTQTAGPPAAADAGHEAPAQTPISTTALVRYEGDKVDDKAKDAPAQQSTNAKDSQPEAHAQVAPSEKNGQLGSRHDASNTRPESVETDRRQRRPAVPKATTSSAKAIHRKSPPDRAGAYASTAPPTQASPKRAYPPRHPIEISPPRHPNQPRPTLFDIATAFLDSDVMSRLDLSVLQDLDEGSGGDGGGGGGNGETSPWPDLRPVAAQS
ncbi:hypothetical protein HDU86_003463 [Geranomyces michiganensis]|nr:hypothetical protein HDU86_003463 [Geranomyces michiganensis]